METKICTKCGVEKPATVDWFGRQKSGKGGMKAWCKECTNEYMKEYHEKNKEELKKYSEKYREDNKNHIKECREDNKERKKKYLEEYRKNNKEKIKKRNKKYVISNAEKISVYQQNYRTLKHSLPSTLTFAQWQSTKDYFNHECAYCGKQLKNLTKEHVIPLSKGGGYTKGNIIPSCQPCNWSKSASNMKFWYLKQSYFSIERYNKILAFIEKHKSVHDYTPIAKGRCNG